MASNFYYGGGGNQNSNLLTYPMKGLSIGAPHSHLDPGIGNTASSLNQSLVFSRSAVSTAGDSGISNALRTHNSRPGTLSDFISSQLGPTSSSIRPSVLASVTGVGLTNGSSALTGQNGYFKANDRLSGAQKQSDSEDYFRNLRIPATASRVLSSLHETNQLSNNLSPDNYAFTLNRFSGAAGGDSFGTDASISNPNTIHSAVSHNMAQTNSFGSMLSSHPSFTNASPSVKPNVQQTFQTHSLANSGLGMSLAKTPVDLNPTGKLVSFDDIVSGASSSQYYSNRQLETTRDLQATGSLKAPTWILVPPVPEVAAAHMRTGRIHELKSRACSNRVFNASYMDHELKQVLHNKIQACLFVSEDSAKEKLPRYLGAYTDLVSLETMHQPRVSVTFGLPSVCYKAWSPRFNRPMLLHRLVLPVDQEAGLCPEAFVLAKQLAELDHPAVMGFRDIFFTNAFNDNSAVVVYEYAPCSSTLQQIHMSDPMKLTSFSSPFNITRTVRPHSSLKNGPSDLGMLTESTAWSYLVQLVHGLRFIHQQVHRACGVLDPTKVLIQDGTRLRINCFGLKDILFYQSQNPSLAEDQAADFIQLGQLMLGVACGTSEAIQMNQRATSFNLLQRTYRPELVTLIRDLITGQVTGIDQLLRATAPFVYDQLTATTERSDFFERQLFLSMECDRLFRLVSKLQSIVERSDRNSSNPDWSETGDRYMLKLFRDFVFHQTDHMGAPYLDLAHIISTLNKVDAGSTERLCLVSRDSQNVIIVTYADIKQWLNTSFAHLADRHRQSRCDIQLAQQRDALQHQSAVLTSASSTAAAASAIMSMSDNDPNRMGRMHKSGFLPPKC